MPFGKMFKIAKAMPALRKLVSKAGDIRDAFKARKARVSPALDRVTTPPGCLRRAGFAGEETYRFATAGDSGAIDTQFEYPGWRNSWAGFIQVADKCNIPDTVVYTPQGNPPIMASYAGEGVSGLPEKTQAALNQAKGDYSTFRMKDTGYPDFSPWIAKHPDTGKSLRLENFEYQSSRKGDNAKADKLAGITAKFRKENNLTWHHSEIEGVMELVPTELNNAVKHSGGFSMWGAGSRPVKPTTDTKDASWITQKDIFTPLTFPALISDSSKSKSLSDFSSPKATGSYSDKPAAGNSLSRRATSESRLFGRDTQKKWRTF